MKNAFVLVSVSENEIYYQQQKILQNIFQINKRKFLPQILLIFHIMDNESWNKTQKKNIKISSAYCQDNVLYFMFTKEVTSLYPQYRIWEKIPQDKVTNRTLKSNVSEISTEETDIKFHQSLVVCHWWSIVLLGS